MIKRVKLSVNAVNKNYLLVLCLSLKFIVQYAVNGSGHYELHRDEFLHLDQARHLAGGFYSVPPFTSWISWIILQLGNTIFWVKFFPALFGALTILVAWKTVEALNGKLYACLLTAAALIFSSLLRLNLLYQPNSPDIFFWTLLLYTVVRYIQTEKSKWLYFAALATAFGFLNKYSIAFCIAGLLPALLLTKYRKILLNKELYLAILLTLLIISPNLLWQYQHHFPVLKHMKELRETQLVNISRMGFLKEQLMLFLGALPLLIAAFAAAIFYRPFHKYRLLFIAWLATICLFAGFRAKGYYAYGLYPVFIAFGAAFLENIFQRSRGRWLRALPFFVVFLLFIPMLKITFPLKSPEQFYQDARLNKPFSHHTWEDGKTYPIAQDFADMLGWKELAAKTDSLYNTLEDKEHTIIITNNYGQAGAVNYYSKHPGINAVSFNADYINWFNLQLPVHNIIRIISIEDSISEKEKAVFEKITETGRITNKYAREYGTKICLMKGARIDLRTPLKAMILNHQ